MRYLFITFFVFLSVLKSISQDDSINCTLVDTFLNEKYTIGILDLDRVDFKTKNSFINVRFIDKYKYLKCLDTVNYFGNIKAFRTEKLSFTFNTGLFREVVIDKIIQLPNKTYVLTFLLFEYGCYKKKVNVYSLAYHFKISKESEVIILGKTIGDVDLY